MNKKKPTKETIIRTIVLFFALLNQLLVMAGFSPLPFLDEDLAEVLSYILTIVAAVVSWWKNNSFSHDAIKADEYLQRLKEQDSSRKG